MLSRPYQVAPDDLDNLCMADAEQAAQFCKLRPALGGQLHMKHAMQRCTS